MRYSIMGVIRVKLTYFYGKSRAAAHKKQRRELKKQEEQTEQQQSQLDARSHRRLIGAGVIAALVIVVLGCSSCRPELRMERFAAFPKFPIHLRAEKAHRWSLNYMKIFSVQRADFFQPTVKELMAKYGDQIKVVYNDFPLSIHRYGRVAAIARRRRRRAKVNFGNITTSSTKIKKTGRRSPRLA